MVFCLDQGAHAHIACEKYTVSVKLDLIMTRRRTLTFLKGILLGKWVIASSWLKDAKRSLPGSEEAHEVSTMLQKHDENLGAQFCSMHGL